MAPASDLSLSPSPYYYQTELDWQVRPMYLVAGTCLQMIVCLPYSMLARPCRPEGQVMAKAFLF